MTKYLFVLAAVLLFAGCAVMDEQTLDPVPSEATLCDADNRPEVCTREYMPVCGDDNETYSNSCVACSSENVAYHTPGACDEQSVSEDACGASQLQDYVGEHIDSFAVAEYSDSYRVINPGDAITMDYRIDRLNVYLDENGFVETISCG